MNILLASDGYVERTGVCLFMLQWGSGIRSLSGEYIITVYFRKSVKDKKLAEEFKEHGMNIVTGELAGTASCMKPRNRKKICEDIRTILEECQYDVVHVNSSAYGFTSIVLRESARNGVVRRIAHCHGRVHGNGRKWMYLWYLKKRVMADATVYAACSYDAGVFFFGETGTAGPEYIYIPNTIQADKYRFSSKDRKRIRKSLGIADNILLLGTVGTLTEVKNHSFLLELIHYMKQSSGAYEGVLQGAKLLIIGEGEQRNTLTDRAEELGIADDVIIYGETADIPGMLSSMDIYVMPSISEGFGMAALEAQANGLTCILSERMPEEVCVTDRVYRLPVDKGIALWAETVASVAEDINCYGDTGETSDIYNTYKEKIIRIRENSVDDIVRSGYDTVSTAEYVRRLYDIGQHYSSGI